MSSRKLGSIAPLLLSSPQSWGLAGMGSAIAIAAWIAPAQAASLTAWNFDPTTNHLEVTVKDGTTPRYFLMAQPARIVMDLPGTSIATVRTQASYGGAVRQIRVSQFQPGMTRIVLELSPGVKLASGQVNLQKLGDATRWLLKPILAESSATIARSPQPAARPVPAPRPSMSAVPSAIVPQSRPIAGPPPLSETTITATPPPSPAASPNDPPAAIVPPAQSAPQEPVTVPPLSSQPPQLSPPKPFLIAPASVNPTSELFPSNPSTLASAQPMPPSAIVPPALQSLPQNSALNSLSPDPVSGPPRSDPSSNPPAQPPTIAPAQLQTATTEFPPTAATKPLPAPSVSVGDVPTGSSASPSLSPVSATESAVRSIPAVPSAAPQFPTATAPASLEIPTTLATASTAPVIAVPSLQALTSNPALPPGSSVDLEPTVAQTLQAPEPNFSAPAQVTVPPLLSPTPAPTTIEAIDLPQSQPSVYVPPLQPPTIAPAVPAPPPSGVIDFGQPLPGGSTLRSSNGSVSAGTLLSLRYPGTASLKLRTGTPHQEVLLLQSEMRDGSGNLIAPRDSQVIGRFETSKAGSRFIAQAISLQGRSIPLTGQSEILAGTMEVSDRNLAVNSGIGAIAGGIIGGFSGAGLVGGAATGAAVTLLTSPKPATVQPGQIVQIRLLQDFQ